MMALPAIDTGRIGNQSNSHTLHAIVLVAGKTPEELATFLEFKAAEIRASGVAAELSLVRKKVPSENGLEELRVARLPTAKPSLSRGRTRTGDT